MNKVLGLVAAAVLLLGGTFAVQAARLALKQIAVSPVPGPEIDARPAAERLARALRFKTVSSQDPGLISGQEFTGLHAFLESAFPRFHSKLAREVVADHSRLFTWGGSDPSLKPILLMAHLDVVPVEPGTEGAWSHPPFAGEIAEGYVWGRGALDDKASALGILEAVERLLEEGAQPRRTVLISFGHDEEVGGTGAARIAETLRAKGIEPEFVLDEGLAILEGIVPGISRPVALVGIAEKGYLSLELSVEVPGGHSSRPPPETAIGLLSAALVRLEQHPMPARVDGVARQMLEHLAPEMPLRFRAPLANLWLFEGLVIRRLAADPSVNALLRTTAAPTIFAAGIKENVLPQRARAVVNFRIRPGDTVQQVIAHVRKALADERIEVKPLEGFREASPVSSVEAHGYATIATTVRQVFPEAVVAPALVIGGTDSRHFTSLSQAVYRFVPGRIRTEDLQRTHGTNERVGVEDHGNGIRFYTQLIRNAAL